ncbi:MAG: phenylalanine--tRNA ligase subunit alpha [Bacillota bacterium]|jgi:phenylalanyl-tRNA synthetase alpha chain
MDKSRMDALLEEAREEMASASTLAELDQVRLRFLGKKGQVTALLKTIGSLPAHVRPAFGSEVNSLRATMEKELEDRRKCIETEALLDKVKSESLDVTLPGTKVEVGGLHPITKALREVQAIFYGMGFTVYESRETETDEMNFVLLNLAPGHPARDMQDTMYLTESTLLRTHTSPGQIRAMRDKKGALPVRIIVPGRVYRRDPADASHSPVFHQVEGLAVDRGVTFRHLRGVFGAFARKFFGEDTEIRMRPSYFPFTEPSVEIDVSCVLCRGKGCSVCGQSGWLELSGAGMVHPRVIRNGGYDPKEVTGFAFGFGLDRAAMLKYGIDDMRVFLGNDKRFLSEWRGL